MGEDILDDEDLLQIDLEQRMGQIECLGNHTAWRLSLGECPWCRAAL